MGSSGAWRCYFFTALLALLTSGIKGQTLVQPEQIHLSYGVSPNAMVVTWSTMDPTPVPIVEYGPGDLTMMAKGNTTKFTDGGKLHRTEYIHRVTLQGLQQGAKYVYHCGSALGWSPLLNFYAMQAGAAWSPRFAVYGDLGNVNAQSLPRLQEEVQRNQYDAILHVGDFAYDMATNDAKVGDEFMRQIEAIAGYVPYMTVPGNHENAYNFSNYMNRFTMPGGDGQGNFYSFDVGPVHIIGLSTEFYFFIKYGTKQIERQRDWLEKDLQKANQNRKNVPWIVTMGHRPMYCTNSDGDDCSKENSIIRLALEDLFFKYGVDVEFWAHEHTYERLWPIYKNKMYNGSVDHPYTNPKAPVHITTGSAGCSERHDNFGPLKDFTAFRSSDYGYTRMTVLNHTALYLEQVSDDKGGQVIDKIWLIKDKHLPYSWY